MTDITLPRNLPITPLPPFRVFQHGFYSAAFVGVCPALAVIGVPVTHPPTAPGSILQTWCESRGIAFAMWLACHTQEEIAEAVEVPQQTIADWMKDFTEMSKADISVKWSDFETPIYNVWKQQTKTALKRHDAPPRP